MKAAMQEIRGKWRYLTGLPRFRRAPAATLFRIALWRLHCALGIPRTINLSPWGVRFFLPPRWRGAGTTMLFAVGTQYDRELAYLRRFIAPGMVVVDGGANCGIYTVLAARLVGAKGRVLSFEPAAETFCALQRNIKLNRFVNVLAHRAALADTDGNARLHHSVLGPNSYSIGRSENARPDSEDVVTRTLDAVFREEDASRLGLIKLDIEGAEELALRGAKQVIAQSRPVIIFEINVPAAKRLGLHPHGAWKMLRNCGYRFFSLTGCEDLRELEQPLASLATQNVIAVHGERWKS